MPPRNVLFLSRTWNAWSTSVSGLRRNSRSTFSLDIRKVRIRLLSDSCPAPRAQRQTTLTSGSISPRIALSTSPSPSIPRGTLPPPVNGSIIVLGRSDLRLSQDEIVGTSQVFPPGYRKGEIWCTDATFTICASSSNSLCETRVAMALLRIAEIFGHDISIPAAEAVRKSAYCPFRNSPCTKGGKSNPMGICSFTQGTHATVVCPHRFVEGNRVFFDAARLAFGIGKQCAAVPEVRVLEVNDGVIRKKIGKVDFLLVHVENQEVIDFAALEVQGVYMSGKSIRPAFDQYLKTGELLETARRRSDFRSSGPKRLMPQLSLKVPIFRRWGKRFFVVVDSTFHAELPRIKEQAEGNGEVTWLVYPFERQEDGGFRMRSPVVSETLWVDVEYALREGEAPEKSAMLRFLTAKAKHSELFIT